MTFSVELEPPPPLNNCYVNVRGRGRTKSPRYRAWRQAAVLSIFSQVPAKLRIGGPVVVYIALPIKMRGDVDGRIKGVLDALVDSKRIDDDKHVIAVTAAKTHDKPTALVRVARAVGLIPDTGPSLAEGLADLRRRAGRSA